MRIKSSVAVGKTLLLMIAVGCGSTESPDSWQEPSAPALDTGYSGDELAIAPPKPGEGFQLHFGPADYTAQSMSEFLINPGEEAEDCIMTTTPNEQDVLVGEFHERMRPGTHHFIIWGLAVDLPSGRRGCPVERDKFIIGSQGNNLDIVDKHDMGLAFRLPARSPIAVNLHSLNTTDGPLLREAWLNFLYADTDQVKIVGDALMFMNLGLRVPPYTKHVERRICEAPTDLNVYMLTGHMHARGVRFSVWANRGGQRDLVYESYNWNAPLEIYYHKNQQNPVPDAKSLRGGGLSGELALRAGDKLEWECEYNNNTAQEFVHGDSSITGEMCNAFGAYYPSMGSNWQCIVVDG